jgi:signal peptidase I
LIGDHILVSKLSYGLQWPTDCKLQWNFPPVNCYTSSNVMPFGKPQRGDVIVFRFPEDEEKDFIKRIVGTPGDTVQIRNKQVLVNGELLDDRAFTQRIDPGIIDSTINPRDNFGPVTVPEGSYFVMGDNRDQSLTAGFGAVREERSAGRRSESTGPGAATASGPVGPLGSDSVRLFNRRRTRTSWLRRPRSSNPPEGASPVSPAIPSGQSLGDRGSDS